MVQGGGAGSMWGAGAVWKGGGGPCLWILSGASVCCLYIARAFVKFVPTEPSPIRPGVRPPHFCAQAGNEGRGSIAIRAGQM